MNQDHHQEQMEAMRREFNELWRSKLVPTCEGLGIRIEQFPILQDIAWQAFLAGKGGIKP